MKNACRYAFMYLLLGGGEHKRLTRGNNNKFKNQLLVQNLIYLHECRLWIWNVVCRYW